MFAPPNTSWRSGWRVTPLARFYFGDDLASLRADSIYWT